jgi:CDP-glucose 4,6-dehydratase
MKKPCDKSFFWKRRRVLATGGAGFIGSWLVKKLLELGANVLVLDLKKESPILDGLAKKPKFLKADVRNFSTVQEVFRRFQPETVFHLAAKSIVSEANENPLETFDTNVRGTYNILEACRQTKSVKRIIVFSSDKAYGDSAKLPYQEDMPLRGTNPYDFSKSCADLMSQMYAKGFDLPLCITRCGNVFGGGDIHFSRLIPGVIRSAFLNKQFVIRSDGKFLRDYIYVEDIIRGQIILVEKMKDKKISGQAFNFGAKYPLSVLKVVEKTLSLMKKEFLSIKILNKGEGEIRNQHLSLKKTQRMLGWVPEISFEEGIKKTIGWYKEYFRKYGE